MDPQIKAELIEVTAVFGDAYKEDKASEKTAEDAKALFYAALNRDLESRRLPRRTIQVPIEEEIVSYVGKWFPEWRLVESTPNGDTLKVIIEKNPAKMKHAFTNPETGMTYQRSNSTGNATVDYERIKADDPDLWEEISVWPADLVSLVSGAIKWARTWDDTEPLTKDDFVEAFDAFLRRRCLDRRVAKPSSEWTKEQAEAIRDCYLLPGKVTVKIVPPRVATEEELAEQEDEEE